MGATQTQIRRDGATALDSATPALGELAYDTTNKRLRVGDGSTVGATTLPNRKDIQDSAFNSATTTNSGNTYAATITGVAAYAAFQMFKLKINASNTGASTININSLGAKNIYKNNGGTIGAIASGDLLADYIYDMVYDGTQFLILGGTGSGSGGVVIVRQVYTAGATWTKPANLLYVDVEALGGGAGGGGANASGNRVGGGGGAGGYARKVIAAASLGATETVTIGSAGAGGTSGGTGSSGGTSSFGSHVSCTGGAGGTGNGSTQAAGGAGGVGSSGDINCNGQYGYVGANLGAGSLQASGRGGNSLYGAGGRERTTDGAGHAATGYGAGGSGAWTTASNNNAGGAGTGGIIIVTEYKSA